MNPTPSIIIDLHTYQVLILENFYSFIQLQEYPIPRPLAAAAVRHKNRHMALSRDPRVVS